MMVVFMKLGNFGDNAPYPSGTQDERTEDVLMPNSFAVQQKPVMRTSQMLHQASKPTRDGDVLETSILEKIRFKV